MTRITQASTEKRTDAKGGNPIGKPAKASVTVLKSTQGYQPRDCDDLLLFRLLLVALLHHGSLVGYPSFFLMVCHHSVRFSACSCQTASISKSSRSSLMHVFQLVSPPPAVALVFPSNCSSTIGLGQRVSSKLGACPANSSLRGQMVVLILSHPVVSTRKTNC